MTALLTYLTLVLFARLLALFRDKPAPFTRIMALAVLTGVLPAAALAPNIPAFGGAVAIGVAHLLLVVTEGNDRARPWGRLITLCITIAIALTLSAADVITLAPWLDDFARHLNEWGPVGQKLVNADGAHTMSVAVCLLLSLAEPNAVVRSMLALWKIEAAEDDRDRLSHHSDLIGILERCLVFIVVALEAYNAAAFILTAKGLVKFHETKDKETAAYVLMGTFLSSVCAFSSGLLSVWLSK